MIQQDLDKQTNLCCYCVLTFANPKQSWTIDLKLTKKWMTQSLTFNPVNANDTSLLFLLSSPNFNGVKHTDLSSCDEFLKKLFCAANKSGKKS